LRAGCAFNDLIHGEGAALLFVVEHLLDDFGVAKFDIQGVAQKFSHSPAQFKRHSTLFLRLRDLRHNFWRLDERGSFPAFEELFLQLNAVRFELFDAQLGKPELLAEGHASIAILSDQEFLFLVRVVEGRHRLDLLRPHA